MKMNWRGLLAAACISTMIAGSLNAEPIVVNGDFEANPGAWVTWPGYAANGDNPASIEGWTATGGNGINPVADGTAPFRDNGANDSYVAFLQGTSTIEQTVSGFSVGSEYELSLEFNARNCCGDMPIGEIYLNDILAASSADLEFPGGGIIPVGGAEPWYAATIPFTAPTEEVTIRISTMPMAGGDSTMLVDNVSVSLVPEPASLSMLLIGLMGVAGLRRRK